MACIDVSVCAVPDGRASRRHDPDRELARCRAGCADGAVTEGNTAAFRAWKSGPFNVRNDGGARGTSLLEQPRSNAPRDRS